MTSIDDPTIPAPFGQRSLAFVIDFALVTAILSAVEWLVPDVSGVVLQIVVSAAELVFLLGYFVVSLARYETTLGKKIFKLKVVADRTGEKITLKRSVMRALVLPFSFIMGAGVLMALFNPRRQALHDMVAGTRVIKKVGKKVGATF